MGICRAGEQTCNALQYGAASDWSVCVASVDPKARDCGTSIDNDCDGIPDNGTGGPAFVKLPEGYCIDRTEVTRAQYQAWLDTDPPTSGQVPECTWNGDFEPDETCLRAGYVCQTECDDHPQVCVDWCDAYAYCKAVGKRLCGKIGGGANGYSDFADPELSQWYNACSSHGVTVFSYGDVYLTNACNGHSYAANLTVEVGTIDTCQAPLSSGYSGVFDLSGNVWEWEDSCDGQSGLADPCRRRGGCFYYDDDLRCDFDSVHQRVWSDGYLGFRCCSI